MDFAVGEPRFLVVVLFVSRTSLRCRSRRSKFSSTRRTRNSSRWSLEIRERALRRRPRPAPQRPWHSRERRSPRAIQTELESPSDARSRPAGDRRQGYRVGHFQDDPARRGADRLGGLQGSGKEVGGRYCEDCRVGVADPFFCIEALGDSALGVQKAGSAAAISLDT